MRDRDLADQLTTMPDGELRATRRDLQAGLGLMRPQSPMRALALAYMDAVTAQLARRAGQQPGARQAPRVPDPRPARLAGWGRCPGTLGCRGINGPGPRRPAGRLPADRQARIIIRDLPSAAFTPGPAS